METKTGGGFEGSCFIWDERMAKSSVGRNPRAQSVMRSRQDCDVAELRRATEISVASGLSNWQYDVGRLTAGCRECRSKLQLERWKLSQDGDRPVEAP